VIRYPSFEETNHFKLISREEAFKAEKELAAEINYRVGTGGFDGSFERKLKRLFGSRV